MKRNRIFTPSSNYGKNWITIITTPTNNITLGLSSDFSLQNFSLNLEPGVMRAHLTMKKMLTELLTKLEGLVRISVGVKQSIVLDARTSMVHL